MAFSAASSITGLNLEMLHDIIINCHKQQMLIIWNNIVQATNFPTRSWEILGKVPKTLQFNCFINGSFRLHGELYSYWQIFKGISVKCLECLNQDAKKKGRILYIMARDDHIVLSVKLLDIMHESYGFSADLIEASN